MYCHSNWILRISYQYSRPWLEQLKFYVHKLKFYVHGNTFRMCYIVLSLQISFSDISERWQSKFWKNVSNSVFMFFLLMFLECDGLNNMAKLQVLVLNCTSSSVELALKHLVFILALLKSIAHNFSSNNLTQREHEAVSHGLDHHIPTNINRNKIKTEFESLFFSRHFLISQTSQKMNSVM